jgi:hypothetical protein
MVEIKDQKSAISSQKLEVRDQQSPTLRSG